MTLRAVKPEDIQKRLKMLVFGPAGVGKTMAAIQFPKNYIIDTEKGCQNYAAVIRKSDSVVLETSSPDDIRQEVKALLTEKHSYRTLTIDPITEYYGALQDKWSLIFANAARKAGQDDSKIEMADWGFRFWAKIKSEYKGVMRMAKALDMNLICTAHEKDIYGAGMQKIGVSADAIKGSEYAFDYVFKLELIGDKRIAKNMKERAPIGQPKFPSEFVWSYENFCKFYGQDILEKESKPLLMATPDQVNELTTLLDTVKVEDDWVSKCLTKADVESWDEMDGKTIQKCIDFLKKKLEPTKKEKVNV